MYYPPMRRILFALLFAGSIAAQASEPIDAPAMGASAVVTQPHVTAELIPEKTAVQAGEPFGVILHLHADPGWHTYWINPGDAGLPTKITWTLPPGFAAGPIQWPTPEKHAMGGLMTFGYAGDVYLLTTITPPKGDLPQHFDVKAAARWLVCQEECIPGKADLTLTLDTGLLNARLPQENTELFAQAGGRLPVENTRWDVSGDYTVTSEASGAPNSGRAVFEMGFQSKGAFSPIDLSHVYFFPEQANVLSPKNPEIHDANPNSQGFLLVLDLIQNGEEPDKLSGVLVSDQTLIEASKAVYISHITVLNGKQSPIGAKPTETPLPDANVIGPGASAPSQGTATATAATQPLLIGVLFFAFIGGLILNLMPCVLPVLSLKVFSLMRHAGENPKAAWLQGVAFTAGVVLSFWVLAGLLLALRAAGNQLGWGFQMQSPGFVLALTFLFFLIALNLFGVFELGSSLVGLDAKATNHLGGLASSFGNGALATVAATPCTAPFMGSALGFAAQQPTFISMLIFTFLALGMATPYLLLTIFPGALRFVPKPGAWMEAFKQFMGFLLLATVIFLVYVFGALVGEAQIPSLLFILLLSSIAAWIYGRWGFPRTFLYVVGVTALYCASEIGLFSGDLRPVSGIVFPLSFQPAKSTSDDKNWQPWSPTAVDQALAQGRPVFVDFTAAWCLSCKVNEAIALDTDAVHKAFADKNVTLLRGDWTQADPKISQTLQKFQRDGVPLYLLYSPKDKATPQVLPQVLTPGIVLGALAKL
jgi:thiol:disulfide interchange protein/DsbC/DsbD-like thiol-disulfide interchange protein